MNCYSAVLRIGDNPRSVRAPTDLFEGIETELAALRNPGPGGHCGAADDEW